MQKTFTNYHLAISKERYADIDYDHDGSDEVIERPTPALNRFLFLLKSVGKKYGWDRRPKYLNYPAIANRLASSNTRYFDILKDGQAVGYVLATKPENSLGWHYTEAAQARKTIEIENFGLFEGQSGHNYGDTALPKVLGILLEDNDNVYLTSRSTNHPKVIPFYEENGMKVIHQEVLADDLIPEHKQVFVPAVA